MKEKPIPPKAAAAELRGQAEARLRGQDGKRRSEVEDQRSEADSQRLVHELQVHQIELEMQNEELVRARAQAEASAEKFSDLYDFAPIGYASVDDRGRIRELNLAAARLLGKSRAALAGTPFVGCVSGPDRDAFLRHLQDASETGRNTSVEVSLSSGGGRIVPVQLYTICHRETGQTPQYWMAITDITERKQAEEEVRRLNAELEDRVRRRTTTIRELAVELTLAEQRERARLAAILHDHVQQLLVAAGFLMEQILDESVEARRETLRDLKNIQSEALDAIRTMSVELSPPVLQRDGLVAAVKWLGTWMLEKHGLAVEVAASSETSWLGDGISVLLYQVVRELLLNVVKHAQVKSACVTLERIGRQLKIVVSDAGKGFDVANLQALTSPETFGLSAARERLALVGGQFEIESTPGRGSRFTLRATLPEEEPGGTGQGRRVTPLADASAQRSSLT